MVDKIKELACDIQKYVRVTEHNIAGVFDYFVGRVLQKAYKYTTRKQVEIFLGCVFDKEHYYKHPSKEHVLLANSEPVAIFGGAFEAFFKHFERQYTPQEKSNISAIADRLIEEGERRKQGAFYTPTKYTDYAHGMMDEAFGVDWREEYIVWDPCCGTHNLTRDYRFRELYCSTIDESELAVGRRYNSEATKFKFDFLNDKNSLLPPDLIKALQEDKPIIIFMNPPYGTACSGVGMEHKEGIAKTVVRSRMLKDGLGGCSEQLYAQFMYKIVDLVKQFKLTKLHVALFCNPLYLAGPKYKMFRKQWFDLFVFDQGVLFNASVFSGVSSDWGINFAIWKSGASTNRREFEHKVLMENAEGIIIPVGTKMIGNLDGAVPASEWVREPVKKLKTERSLNLSSGCRAAGASAIGRTVPGAMGYLYSNANNVASNAQSVAMFTAACSAGHGLSILPSNLYRCAALFAARKAIDANWVIAKDEYSAPNEEHPEYKRFLADSLVFSLFHTSSNQSSLRHVEYQGDFYDVRNEFFWMNREHMVELCNTEGNEDAYEDARRDHQRYIYQQLQEQHDNLSPVAIDVLEKATALVDSTFEYRKLYNDEHPELQVCNWDAGYYQLHGLWIEYDEAGFIAFREAYRKLKACLNAQVYTLGFLPRFTLDKQYRKGILA